MSQGAWGRVDYLSVTVKHVDVEWLQEVAISALVVGSDIDEFEGWCEGISGRHGEELYRAGGVAGLTVIAGQKYARIELKGEVCAVAGNKGVCALLAELAGVVWRATRIDFAWDGFPASVLEVKEAIESQCVRTRLSIPQRADFRQNDLGRTVYLGKRDGERMFRIYDARGPVRFEAEFKGEVAKAICAQLSQTAVEQWGEVGLQHVRGTADFISRPRGENAQRIPIARWWSEFVAEADKAKVVRVKPIEPHVAGKLDGFIQRNARMLRRVFESAGSDYLRERAEHWCPDSAWGPDDEAFVRTVNALCGSQFAGLFTVPRKPTGERVPV